MMSILTSFFGLFLLVTTTTGKTGFGSYDQDWGYYDVRHGAHMFWWLYLTPNTSTHFYYQKPLLIWLQGGPGYSSSGLANFMEFGPLDVHNNPRNHTWVKDYNILFVDSPVGVGFSYVDQEANLPQSDFQVTEDLMQFIKVFLTKHPIFRRVDIYITAQSYGGKIAAEWALKWSRDREINQNREPRETQNNLKGVLLGNSWISPIDSVMAWAPYLLHTGVIDRRAFKTIQKYANRTKAAVDQNNWFEACGCWEVTKRLIKIETHGIQFYNIMNKVSKQSESRFSDPEAPFERLDFKAMLHNTDLRRNFRKNLEGLPASDGTDDKILTKLMNEVVKPHLGISQPWKLFNEDVFIYLAEDFMKPATSAVESLLNETELKVFVHSGQLDLTVSTIGTLDWIERLQWENKGNNATFWNLSNRTALIVGDTVEGFYQSYGNLDFYWVSRAGHDVSLTNSTQKNTSRRKTLQLQLRYSDV